MPDVLGPADQGGGDRALTGSAWDAGRGHGPGTLAAPVSDRFAPRNGTTAQSADGILVCQRVSKWYGPVIGVNQVTLELRPGITGLVGANGAGKTTLMRLITGQLRPDLGRIAVLGKDPWSAAARWHVGYCPDSDAFYEEMSGVQFVEAMGRLCGYPRREARRRAGRALDNVGMTGRAERSLRTYSKGMRQRVKLAQALLHDPELLVLDEPLSGIDPVGRAEFLQLFRELAASGKCLLISSHELDELEKLTDHVAIMAHGRIAAVGPVAAIRDRLDHQPLTICVAVRQGDSKSHKSPAVDSSTDRGRELAAALLRLPSVVGVELLNPNGSEDGVRQVRVRAHDPQNFFRSLTRLVLEEWFDVVGLETLDDSTEAVLGYLLGAK